MRVKPNPNKQVNNKALQVFDPVHCDYLPEKGREVPNNAYWMRRLQVQDVVEATTDTEVEQNAKSFQKTNFHPAKVGKKAGNTKQKTKTTKAPAEKVKTEEAEADEVKTQKNEPEASTEGNEVTTKKTRSNQ